MTTLVNGSVPAITGAEVTSTPAYDALEASTTALVGSVLAELRAQVAAEQAGRAEYERLVRESLERERQMTRALRALETRPADAKSTPDKRERNGARKVKGSRSSDWQPSPAKLAAIWQAVVAYARDHPKGFSVGAVANATPGVSPEATMKAMAVFRGHELVRPVGKVRGGGVKWRLMPGVDGSAMNSTAVEVVVKGELESGGGADDAT